MKEYIIKDEEGKIIFKSGDEQVRDNMLNCLIQEGRNVTSTERTVYMEGVE